MGSWSPGLSWQPGPAGTPPGSDLRVKQQSSARRGHAPRAPLSFWPQLIRSFVSGKPTEPSARKISWNFLLLQLFSRLASGLLGHREAHGEPGSGDGLPALVFRHCKAHLQVVSFHSLLSLSGQQPARWSYHVLRESLSISKRSI